MQDNHIKKKRQEELEKIKRDRKLRYDFGYPSSEIEDIRKNEKLHNTLYNLIKLARIFNRCSKDFPSKEYIQKLRENEEYKNRPIIVAPNHVRKQDIEIIMEAMPEHMILLSGDYENVHGDIGGVLLEKNGIIYFDMENPYESDFIKRKEEYLRELKEYIDLTNNEDLIKEYTKEKKIYDNVIKSALNDRANVKNTIRDILNTGYNMLWFYEGSWNLSQNKPYYDGSYFMVEAAIDTDAIVLPVAYDLTMQDNKKIAVVKFGEPIDYRKIYGNRKLSKEDKKEALDILKGEIGKELLDIWYEYNFINRDSLYKKYGRVPNMEEDLTHDFYRKAPLEAYYEEYEKKVLSEWHFTKEELEAKHFVDKSIVSKEEAFDHLSKIKLNKNNAFLASKRNHF